MATLKEIAELSGVSRGTVDRVLNNRGSVHPKTAEKIKEIAEMLDYHPNKAGLMLAAQKKSPKIGVILFSSSNPFFQEVLDGVTAKAKELSGYNCSVLVEQVPFQESAQCAAIERLMQKGISGLVISPYNAIGVTDCIDSLFDMNIPVITVNTDIPSKRMAYVGSNYYLSGRTAAGLVGRMTFGNVFVGIVTDSSQILCHIERIAGFTEAVIKNYKGIHIVETVENQDDDVESFQAVTGLLKRHPHINVLYFSAAGVYGGCKAVTTLGLAHKVRIFTYDNVKTTKELVEQGIITATICQQPFMQGSWSLDLLSKYLLEGIVPEQKLNYVATDIRIAENI